jgi:hypothetical protein
MTNSSTTNSSTFPTHSSHDTKFINSSSNPTNVSQTITIKQSIQKLLPPNELKNHVAKFVTGTFAFYTTAFLSQCIQYKLKISTGTRPAIIPLMIGATTVAMGSYMGHLSGVGLQSCWNRLQSGVNIQDVSKIGMDAVRQCVEPMKLMFRRDDGLSRSERREKREVWVHAAGV